MAGRLITVSTSVNKKMWVKLSRRVGSFRGYPFVMIFLAGVDDGSSDNWQEVAQDIDSGPDHNPVAGRPVPEKEGRARPNRTKSL